MLEETTERTISGSIVSIPDGMSAPAIDVSVEIEPVQAGSGDPSPENVRPISGWTGCKVQRTGKNLAKLSPLSGSSANYTNLTDNGVSVYSQTTSSAYRLCKFSITNTDSLKGEILNFSCNVVNDTGTDSPRTILRIVDADGNTIGQNIFELTTLSISRSFTIPSNLADGCSLVLFLYSSSGGIGEQRKTWSNIQLELGSTATPYEPYQGNQYQVSWQTEAGTVYGGTLDVTSGKLVIDREIVDLGSLNWAYNEAQTRFLSSERSSVIKAPSSNGSTIKALCSQYAYMSLNALGINKDGCAVSTTKNIYVKDLAYSDKDIFKTAMSGVQFVYELATPVEITLTPTEIALLQGTNNIWSDSGNVTMQYLFNKVKDFLETYLLMKGVNL